jgi:SAM-dependent methyltransferase
MGTKAAKDRMFEAHPYGEYAVARKTERAKKYRDSDVLVAGCGAGARVFDRYFEGANVTAVDQSARAIEFVRQGFEKLGVEPPKLVCADLLEVDLPADTFDYVLCYGVLHHTVDPERVLSKLADACRPDGTVEILVYNRRSLVRVERSILEAVLDAVPLGRLVPEETKRRFEWWDKYENPLWRTYTVEEAVSLVRSAGLAVDDLWMDGRLFDDFTGSLVPPILQRLGRRSFDEYRWHIRIEASPRRTA